jgi:hypothetical protein
VIYVPQLQTAPLSQKIKGYEKSPMPDPEKLATLEKGRLDSENAIRTGLIQGIGGTVLLIGLYFTYQNLRATQRNVAIAEDKQVTERFSKAVDMLSSSSLHTRLGGIYALERIANDSDKDYRQVMEVLTAFVREESPWPPKDAVRSGVVEEKAADQIAAAQPEEALPAEPSVVAAGKTSQSVEPQAGFPEWKEQESFVVSLPRLRTDIQAIMTVLGRRKHRYGKGEWETQRLDLRKTDLRKLYARRANLTGVILVEAHLEGADMEEVHLERAWLSEVHLEEAWLPKAHLEEAELWQAYLEKTNLSQTHLQKASLRSAHLEEAYLHSAQLEGADFLKVHLKGADLSQVLGLTQAQLDSARTDENTVLPDYLLAAQPPPQAPIAPPSPATAEPSSEPQPPQPEL